MKLVQCSRIGMFSLVSLALLPIARVHADTVVYDNAVNLTNITGGAGSDPGYPLFIGDTFTLATGSTFNQVQYFGLYYFSNTPTAPDNFTITFYNTSGGVPDAIPFAGGTFAVGDPGRSSTGSQVEGFDIYSYVANLSSAVTLNAGTYGISIVNDTASDADDNWGWGANINGGTYFYRFIDQSSSWDSGAGKASFTLVNTSIVAPEPGSFALILPFMVGMIAQRKRCKN